MSDINQSEYSLAQLRAWVRELNMPASGNKAALILRLNAVPAEKRGVCPGIIEGDDSVILEDDDEASGGDNGESPLGSIGEYNDEASAAGKGENSNVINDKLRKREAELLKMELDLAKRENLILVKEMQLLKLEARTTVVQSPVDKNFDFGFNTTKDSLPDFDGNGNVDQWTTQLLNAAKMFSLSDDVLKALLWCKVKGCAQSWLASKDDYISMDVHVLIDEIRKIFKPKISKLQLRQKFEKRMWVFGESFTSYYNDKILLSHNLQMEDGELVEYLIQGITDPQLRTQAAIQCFESPEKFLRSFSTLEISKPVAATKIGNRQPEKTRCYNCNGMGHYANDCKKPKREYGACYGCGSKEHLVSNCPERKVVHVVEGNDHTQEAQLFYQKRVRVRTNKNT